MCVHPSAQIAMATWRGTIELSTQLSGQQVVLFVNAQSRTFDVSLGNQPVKHVPIKGLRGEIMPLERYVINNGVELAQN